MLLFWNQNKIIVNSPLTYCHLVEQDLWLHFLSLDIACVLTYVYFHFLLIFLTAVQIQGRETLRSKFLQNTAGGKNCLQFSPALPFNDTSSLLVPFLGVKF